MQLWPGIAREQATSKDWDLGTADVGYTSKSYHSTAPGPYDWPPAGQPHATYRVASSSCEQRWTLGMVVVVEVAVVYLLLAAADSPTPAVVPALACNTFL